MDTERLKNTMSLTENRDDYEHCRINVINGSESIVEEYKNALNVPIDVPCNLSVRYYKDYATLNEDLKSTKLSDKWFNIFFFNLDDNTDLTDMVLAMDLIEKQLDEDKYCLVASSDEDHNTICSQYKAITGKEWQFVEIKYFDNNFSKLATRVKEMIISHSKEFLCRWENSICILERITKRKMTS